MIAKILRRTLKITISWVLLTTAATAQIVPDTTLPDNSQVDNSVEGVDRITGGTTRGTNLFHSFQEFSVLNGKTAHFDNAVTIENIFSRVTGSSSSLIDGLIKASGTANLFLLNPNGIIFTKNARLDIGGSFIGTTADSIKFADGTEFSATNPNGQPLLTISIPVGLQFRATPSPIEVQGVGHSKIIGETGELIGFKGQGLRVKPGQNLALVGGEITLEGGNLRANAGRVELGSIGEEAVVGLSPTDKGWTFNYESVENFQNITFSNAASINTSGQSGGELQLQGREVRLIDGSVILANTAGTLSAGNLTITASELLEISGISPEDDLPGAILAETTGAGSGGKITITTGQLIFQDGGQASSLSFGTGNAGYVTINASSVQLIGQSTFPSGLFAETYGSGDGGVITIIADQLNIQAGARVEAITWGEGKGGDIIINAKNFEIFGTSPDGSESGLFANTIGGGREGGNGGNITISTEKFSLREGAAIAVNTTFSQGKAGNIMINAKNVEIINASLGSITRFRATGDGGSITINTDKLLVNEGGQISTSTVTNAQAGDITINASETVELIGGDELGASGLFANAFRSAGNGGNITVNTENLKIKDGAQINVSNFQSQNLFPPGSGTPGNIIINARNISLNNGQISSASNADGNAGNITLQQADTVSLENNAQITARTEGAGNGGEILLQTNWLSLTDKAQITASTEGAGAAGKITLEATENASINNSNVSSAVETLATGNAGEISIKAANISVENNSNLSTATAGEGNAGNVALEATETVKITDSIATSAVEASQTGNAGIVAIKAKEICLDNSTLSSSTTGVGNAGDVNLETDSLLATNKAKVTVNTSGAGTAGFININANDVVIKDNSLVEASTSGGLCKTITVNANTLETSNGGQIRSITSGNSAAGNIVLKVAENISLEGDNSGVIADTATGSTGQGGNIFVESNNVTINNGANISVNSEGAGTGGNILIIAEEVTQNNNGAILAQTASTDGGNISLEVDKNILLNPNSEISATAGTSQSGGDGGNVTTQSEFLILSDNSKITANAFQGNGGNINITAQGIFGSPTSQITATSQFGVDGIVETNTPDNDPAGGLFDLSQNVVNAEDILARDFCKLSQNSSFYIVGTGGLPHDPQDFLELDDAQVNWVQPALKQESVELTPPTPPLVRGGTTDTWLLPAPNITASTHKHIIPARGWIFNEKGEVVLVGYDPTQIGVMRQKPQVRCQ